MTPETLRYVVQHAQIAFATRREANLRVGRDVYSVPSVETLTEWIVQQTGQATCPDSVKNPRALLVDHPDYEEVRLIREENPDRLWIANQFAEVDYSCSPALVIITLSSINDRSFEKLPDEGVFLPSGRGLEVELRWADIPGQYARGIDIQQLKAGANDAIAKAQEHLQVQKLRGEIAATHALIDKMSAARNLGYALGPDNVTLLNRLTELRYASRANTAQELRNWLAEVSALIEQITTILNERIRPVIEELRNNQIIRSNIPGASVAEIALVLEFAKAVERCVGSRDGANAMRNAREKSGSMMKTTVGIQVKNIRNEPAAKAFFTLSSDITVKLWITAVHAWLNAKSQGPGVRLPHTASGKFSVEQLVYSLNQI